MNLRLLVGISVCLMLTTAPAVATVYYVSPAGKDGEDGLSISKAWESIDNGDLTGVLNPGDTVNIITGVYTPSSTITLSTSGTIGQSIVYRSFGSGVAVIDAGAHSNDAVEIDGSNVVLDGVQIGNTQGAGIRLSGDDCELRDCYLRDIGGDGIVVEGDDNLILRCQLSAGGGNGISIPALVQDLEIYQNTLDDCQGAGIQFALLSLSTGRAVNNIIADCDRGVESGSLFRFSYNCFYNNPTGHYTGLSVDSTGSIYENPQFVDPATGDFELKSTSPCIDAGLDIGYTFEGVAPDMGAEESVTPERSGMRMVTGQYTGNGVAGRAVDSLGFRPDFVIIKCNCDEPAIARSSTMTGDMAKPLGTNDAVGANWIMSLDADGFTVGSQSQVNGLGTEYYWTAFKASSGEMDVGFYVGTHIDDVGITTPGFRPAYVIVMSEDSEHAMQRFSSEPIDASFEFRDNDEKGNRIQDFESDGFQVGDHNTVNKLGILHHYIAWSPAATHIGTKSYVGNGANNRNILGFGFQPQFALVKSERKEPTVIRPSSLLGDNSLPLHAGVAFPGGIRSLHPDGFQVGNVKAVNEDGQTIYSVVFRDAPVNIAEMSLTKSAKSDIVNPGDTVIYTLLLKNNGPARAKDLVIQDTIPTGLSYVTYETINGTYSEVSGLWSADNLDSGNVETLTLYFTVDTGTGGQTIANVASIINIREYDPILTNNTDAVKIYVNQPPVLAAIGDQSVDEGSNLNFDVYATDPDATTPSLSAIGIPLNASFVDHGDGSGTFDFNPDSTQPGDYSVLFVASDGLLADSEWVTITVNDVNAAPIWDPVGPQSVDEGQTLITPVSANDPDGDDLALSAQSVPLNAAFVDSGNGKGTLTFSPDYQQAGLYSVQLIATDGLLADTIVVSIVVVDVNQAPQIDAVAPQVVDEGQNLSLRISASDPDGTTPSLMAENIPLNAVFSDSGNGAGSLTFDPDYDQAGVYSVRVIATDGDPADTENVSITVTNTNRVPTLNPTGPYTVDEGQILTFDVSAVDPDDDSLILSVRNLPLNATFVDSGQGIGTFEFHPDYNQAGVYALWFIADDGGLADSELVNITVNNVNRAPILNPINDKVVGLGQTLQIKVTATDPDGTFPSLTAPGIPANASFSDSGNGIGGFVFVPDSAQLGIYAITIIASDTFLADSVSFDVTVVDTNSAPVLASIGPQSLTEGDTITILLSATDPDSTIPTLSAENLPINAALIDSGNGSGTIVFMPSYVQAGIYIVDVIASDGSLADSETVTITVNEAGNQAPILNPIGPQSAIVGELLTFPVSATDPDETTPSLNISVLPPNAGFVDSANGTGSFSITPASSQIGLLSVVFIASDGSLADSLTVSITISAGGLSEIVITPDSVVMSADTVQQFTVTGYDSYGNVVSPGTISWGITGPIGTVSSSGLFDAISVGQARIVATSSLGPVDSSSYLEVIAGALDVLTIAPSSALLTVGSTKSFAANGLDKDGNTADLGTVTWTVLGNIGAIDDTGLFTAEDVGTGQIVATSSEGGVTDTTGDVTVVSNGLANLFVTPDTASLLVNSTATFNAIGFTADYQAASVGTISWEVIGDIGTIDADGQFTATKRGVGRIAATSSINGTSDTSSAIVVDVLMASEIPLGNRIVHAGDSLVPILGFVIENRFQTARGVQQFTLRDASHGAGSKSELLSNIATVQLYQDSDGNGFLTASDGLMTSITPGNVSVVSFTPLIIAPGSQRGFFVAQNLVGQPHDADSLDLFVVTGNDILTTDGSVVGGADTLNSLGLNIIDGLTRKQLSLLPTGRSSIEPSDGLAHVLALDVPRNGYDSDTLEVLSIKNHGTAHLADFDSLVCFVDDGNGAWGGPAQETAIGNLEFTGGLWSVSGLSVPLTAPLTRFYVAAQVSQFAEDGVTLSLGVPIHGLELASANDGPIDGPIDPTETIGIVAAQFVDATIIELVERTLIPGTHTGPLIAVRLTNGLSDAVQLAGLTSPLIANDSDGATQNELDSQVDSVALWLKRHTEYNHIDFIEDSLLGTAIVSSGTVHFEFDPLNIDQAGGEIALAISAYLSPLNCKNNNTLTFGVQNEVGFEFVQPPDILGEFPMANDKSFTIDAFPALSAQVHELSGQTLLGGQTDAVVFDLSLPRNGYRTDSLTSLSLTNVGSVFDENALAGVTLWADQTGDGWTEDDLNVGAFESVNGMWRLDDIAFPLSSPQNRFSITVDVELGGFDGGTLKFEIPKQGITLASGTDGPDDAALSNSEAHVILPSNRITVVSIPSPLSIVSPGEGNNVLTTFALYNGYSDGVRTLDALTLTNITIGSSTPDYADDELGQVSLVADENGSRDYNGDPILATGYFVNGRLNLAGLNLALPSEQLTYLFIVCDLPLDVIDEEVLNVTVSDFSDFKFASAVNINGDVPLSGSQGLVIDGSVSAQYNVLSPAFSTLSPTETDVVVFGFDPAFNGDLTDTLTEVSVQNDGTADTSDVSGLSLWIDADRDGAVSPGDSQIGTFEFDDGVWTVDNLSEVITRGPPRYLVAASFVADASPGATVRLSVPIGGCVFVSDNDGPIDTELSVDHDIIISNSALSLALDPLRKTYSVGQTIAVGLTATNLLSTAIEELTPIVADVWNAQLVTLDSIVPATVHLDPGASVGMTYYYTALDPGHVSWDLQVVASVGVDSSAIITTSVVQIQWPPSPVHVDMVNSIPPSVTRGQENVFPFTLLYEHPDTVQDAAPIRLDSVIVTFLDGDGHLVLASDVINGLVLATGFENLVVLSDIPQSTELTLRFTKPVTMAVGKSRQYSLLVDISDSASVESFALSIVNSAAIPIVDDNTGDPVPFDPGVVFPLATASCRILSAAQQLAASSESLLKNAVNAGQQEAGALRVRLRHSGTESSSQIQLSSVSCVFEDQEGEPLPVSQLVENVWLTHGDFVVGAAFGSQSIGSAITIPLSAPVTFNPGEVIYIDLNVSVKDDILVDGFRVSIPDSSSLHIRDLSSGRILAAVTDPEILPVGNAFPMVSTYATIKQPAVAPNLCMESLLPGAVTSGLDGLPIMRFTASSAADPSTSPVVFDAIRVIAFDTLGRVLDPARLFDRIGYRLDGGEIDYQPIVTLSLGGARFELGDEGVQIGPVDTVTIDIVADIEAEAGFDHFVLNISDATALKHHDATDPSHAPGFASAPSCEWDWPFSTSVARIIRPSGQPLLLPNALPTQNGSPGQTGVALMDFTFQYDTPEPKGDLRIESLAARMLDRATGQFESANVASVLDEARLIVNGQIVASQMAFDDDSITLSLDQPYMLREGESAQFRVVADIAPGAMLGNYLLQFDDSSFVHMVDDQLESAVRPILNQGAYPFRGPAISIADASLESSFTNYPNPFNPASGELTTIAFHLEQPAVVDLSVYTITGELVRDLIKRTSLPSGTFQDVSWDGSNRNARFVVPGTYFCRITAEYATGEKKHYQRKIAVVR